jgi:hypothetical protein
MAARGKVPAIGSAQWILNERHQANDLVTQEVEDFGFSVRNELEWLNEHMGDIFAKEGVNVMEVFKTPGKLRGKTPRTARKQKAAEPRKPLTPIRASNTQNRPSPALQSLQKSIQKSAQKSKLHIAQDAENIVQSPVLPRVLFVKPQPKSKGKAKQTAEVVAPAVPTEDEVVVDPVDPIETFPQPPQWGYASSTQETAPHTQMTDVFTQENTQSTQATQFSQSTQESKDDERRDTGDSFVSAKEAFDSQRPSNRDLRDQNDIDMVDAAQEKSGQEESAGTVIHHPIALQPVEIASDNDALDVSEAGTVVHHDVHEESQHAVSPIRVDFQDGSENNGTVIHHAAASNVKHDSAVNSFEDDFNQSLKKPNEMPRVASEQYSLSPKTAEALDTVIHHEDVNDPMDLDDVRSPSDGSSPVKPLVRKSSLTFASLPAREPLAKKSVGNRISRTSHVEQATARGSQFGRFTGGKSLGGIQHTAAANVQQDDEMDVDEDRPILQREESETTKMHNKTSTQRLHERINMLKQMNEPAPKIGQQANASQLAHPIYPQLATDTESKAKANTATEQRVSAKETQGAPTQAMDDDDEDWIAPIKPSAPVIDASRPVLTKTFSADDREELDRMQNRSSPMRPVQFGQHAKSASTTNIPSPTRLATAAEIRTAMAASISNPDLSAVLESTTPVGSPSNRRYMDGPLSASKAKFYSALRAAKEKIIGSSAASAQVKLDALPESPKRPALRSQHDADDVFTSPKRNEKVGTSLFSQFRSPSKESVKSMKSSKTAAGPSSPIRKTRSSTEREKQRERDAREQKKHDEKLDKMREREQQKAAAHFQKEKAIAATKAPSSPTRKAAPALEEERVNSADEMPPPPPPKSLLPTGTGQKLREPRRVVKTQSKDTLPKAKPQVIRVNLANNRFGQNNGNMAPPPPKQSDVTPKSSNESIRPASTQPPATRTNRALTAAANKKREEERKAQERKQRAKANEAAAAAAAKEREEKAKAERERQNKARLEKQRKDEEERKARAAALKQAQEAKQKAEAQPTAKHGLSLYPMTKAPASRPRADLGASRAPTQMQTVQESNRGIVIPPVNPAKPPKRIFQPEEDEPIQRSTLQRAGAAYQQVEGKRRRTLEEDDEPEPIRKGPTRPSVKAPPIRQSNMRKDAQQNKYQTAGYVPVAQMQQSTSMLKAATAHAQNAHNAHMQYANGKIPFAESSNAAANAYKTPARPGSQMGPPPKSAARSSPHYPNGENISLPEIMTDSEDEDSDNEFNPPSWANSPALRDLLSQQQLMDPEKIFGPIAPLHMEQVFPNKERHKRFRDRTSSAYWANDQLTEEDKKKDKEARERLAQVGAWQYHPSPGPAGKS